MLCYETSKDIKNVMRSDINVQRKWGF